MALRYKPVDYDPFAEDAESPVAVQEPRASAIADVPQAQSVGRLRYKPVNYDPFAEEGRAVAIGDRPRTSERAIAEPGGQAGGGPRLRYERVDYDPFAGGSGETPAAVGGTEREIRETEREIRETEREIRETAQVGGVIRDTGPETGLQPETAAPEATVQEPAAAGADPRGKMGAGETYLRRGEAMGRDPVETTGDRVTEEVRRYEPFSQWFDRKGMADAGHYSIPENVAALSNNRLIAQGRLFGFTPAGAVRQLVGGESERPDTAAFEALANDPTPENRKAAEETLIRWSQDRVRRAGEFRQEAEARGQTFGAKVGESGTGMLGYMAQMGLPKQIYLPMEAYTAYKELRRDEVQLDEDGNLVVTRDAENPLWAIPKAIGHAFTSWFIEKKLSEAVGKGKAALAGTEAGKRIAASQIARGLDAMTAPVKRALGHPAVRKANKLIGWHGVFDEAVVEEGAEQFVDALFNLQNQYEPDQTAMERLGQAWESYKDVFPEMAASMAIFQSGQTGLGAAMELNRQRRLRNSLERKGWDAGAARQYARGTNLGRWDEAAAAVRELPEPAQQFIRDAGPMGVPMTLLRSGKYPVQFHHVAALYRDNEPMMRRGLKALGMADAEIDAMTPEQRLGELESRFESNVTPEAASKLHDAILRIETPVDPDAAHDIITDKPMARTQAIPAPLPVQPEQAGMGVPAGEKSVPRPVEDARGRLAHAIESGAKGRVGIGVVDGVEHEMSMGAVRAGLADNARLTAEDVARLPEALADPDAVRMEVMDAGRPRVWMGVPNADGSLTMASFGRAGDRMVAERIWRATPEEIQTKAQRRQEEKPFTTEGTEGTEQEQGESVPNRYLGVVAEDPTARTNLEPLTIARRPMPMAMNRDARRGTVESGLEDRDVYPEDRVIAMRDEMGEWPTAKQVRERLFPDQKLEDVRRVVRNAREQYEAQAGVAPVEQGGLYGQVQGQEGRQDEVAPGPSDIGAGRPPASALGAASEGKRDLMYKTKSGTSAAGASMSSSSEESPRLTSGTYQGEIPPKESIAHNAETQLAPAEPGTRAAALERLRRKRSALVAEVARKNWPADRNALNDIDGRIARLEALERGESGPDTHLHPVVTRHDATPFPEPAGYAADLHELTAGLDDGTFQVDDVVELDNGELYQVVRTKTGRTGLRQLRSQRYTFDLWKTAYDGLREGDTWEDYPGKTPQFKDVVAWETHPDAEGLKDTDDVVIGLDRLMVGGGAVLIWVPRGHVKGTDGKWGPRSEEGSTTKAQRRQEEGSRGGAEAQRDSQSSKPDRDLNPLTRRVLESAKQHNVVTDANQVEVFALAEAIARIDGKDSIDAHHMAEAVQYVNNPRGTILGGWEIAKAEEDADRAKGRQVSGALRKRIEAVAKAANVTLPKARLHGTVKRKKEPKTQLVIDAENINQTADRQKKLADEISASIAEPEAAQTEPAPAESVAAGRAIGEIHDEALTKKDGPRRGVVYRAVDAEEAKAIEQKTGVNVAGYGHAIDTYGVRHSYDRHGDARAESARGQVAITRKDFERIPDVVQPDNIERTESNARGQLVIIYRKRVNGEEYVAEEVRTGKKQLALATLYKRKSGIAATGDLVKPAESEPARQTSETLRSEIPPEESIPHETQVAPLESVAAGQEVASEPSEAQKEAGNYKKAHVTFNGFDITIENPVGSVRRGVSKSGKAWESVMAADYGYFLGTEGKDKDHIDVFIKPGASEGGPVFVVNQVDPETGAFDEHKVMMGYVDAAEAKAGYLAHYEKGWKGLGELVAFRDVAAFRDWVDTGNTTKPAKVVPPLVARVKRRQAEKKDEEKTKATTEAQSKEEAKKTEAVSTKPTSVSVKTPRRQEEEKKQEAGTGKGSPSIPYTPRIAEDERERLMAKHRELYDALESAVRKMRGVQSELEKTKWGSKARERVQKRLDDAKAEARAIEFESKSMGLDVRRARLEIMAESEDEGHRLIALSEIADTQEGRKAAHAAYRNLIARELEKNGVAFDSENDRETTVSDVIAVPMSYQSSEPTAKVVQNAVTRLKHERLQKAVRSQVEKVLDKTEQETGLVSDRMRREFLDRADRMGSREDKDALFRDLESQTGALVAQKERTKAEAKKQRDARETRRPEASVLSRIVAAATNLSETGKRFADLLKKSGSLRVGSVVALSGGVPGASMLRFRSAGLIDAENRLTAKGLVSIYAARAYEKALKRFYVTDTKPMARRRSVVQLENAIKGNTRPYLARLAVEDGIYTDGRVLFPLSGKQRETLTAGLPNTWGNVTTRIKPSDVLPPRPPKGEARRVATHMDDAGNLLYVFESPDGTLATFSGQYWEDAQMHAPKGARFTLYAKEGKLPQGLWVHDGKSVATLMPIRMEAPGPQLLSVEDALTEIVSNDAMDEELDAVQALNAIQEEPGTAFSAAKRGIDAYQHAFGARGQARPRLSEEDILRAIPGARVRRVGDEFEVTAPNGSLVLIRILDDIKATPEAVATIRRTYSGMADAASDAVINAWFAQVGITDGVRTTTAADLIVLAAGRGETVGTVRHEALHWARSLGLFAPAEWRGLVNRHAKGLPEEQQEEAIARAMETKETFWRRVMNYLKRVLGRLVGMDVTGLEAEAAFRSGRVFEREAQALTTEARSAQRGKYAIGDRLKDLDRDFPRDSEKPTLLNVARGIKAILEEVKARFMSWPDTIEAVDGSTVLLHNPEGGSLAERAKHLVWDNEANAFKPQKARWLPNVPGTLQHAAVRLVDETTGNRVYVREYADGTKHMVVVRPDGEVEAQRAFTGSLITQFPSERGARQWKMRVDWERKEGTGRSQENPGPTPLVSAVPGPRQEEFRIEGTTEERRGQEGARYAAERELAPERQVRVAEIASPRYSRLTPRQARNRARMWALGHVRASYRNTDTGWDIEVSRDGLHKLTSGQDMLEHYESIHALPALLENAVLVESHPDRDGNANIRAVHRFYAPIRIGERLMRAKMTVKETVKGRRLYDHALTEIEMPVSSTPSLRPGDAAASEQTGKLPVASAEDVLPRGVVASQQPTGTLSVRDLLRGVKGWEVGEKGTNTTKAPRYQEEGKNRETFTTEGTERTEQIPDTAPSRRGAEARRDKDEGVRFSASVPEGEEERSKWKEVRYAWQAAREEVWDWLATTGAGLLRRDITPPNAKPDLGASERWLKTIYWYKDSVATLARVYSAAENAMGLIKHRLQDYMFGKDPETGDSDLTALIKLKRQKPGLYKRINRYLVDLDVARGGYTVKKDKGRWKVFTPEGAVAVVVVDKEEGWQTAHALEHGDLAEREGVEFADAVLKFRGIMDRRYLELRGSVKKLIDEVESEGRDVSGEYRDLWTQIQEMGDLRGSYFPRTHQEGRYWVEYFEDGKNPIREAFDTKTRMRGRVDQLEKEGFVDAVKNRDTGSSKRVIYGESNKPSERAYSDLSIAAMNDVIVRAVEDVKKRLQREQDLDWKGMGIETDWVQYTRKDGTQEPHLVIRTSKGTRADRVIREQFGALHRYDDSQTASGEGWHFPHASKTLEREIYTAILEDSARQTTLDAIANAVLGSVADTVKMHGSRYSKIGRSGDVGLDVVKGYEEDLIKATVQSVTSTAGGTAKGIMAKDMLNAFLGMDVSWQEYFDEHKPENWDDLTEQEQSIALRQLRVDYYEWVREKRIDSAHQPNAFNAGLDFMADMLRNEDEWERMIGMIRGLTAIKYMAGTGGRVLGNLSNLFEGVPVAFNEWAGIPMLKAIPLVVKAGEQYVRWTSGGAVLPQYRKAFELIRERGWDSALLNTEAIGAMRGTFGRGYDRGIQVLMFAQESTERLNRGSTIAAAYLYRRNQGDSEEQALAVAKQASDRAHAVYGRLALPDLARGGGLKGNVLRSVYTFQGFVHNRLQLIWHLARKGNMKGLAYLIVAPDVIAGAGITKPIAAQLISLVLAAAGEPVPDDPLEEFYAWLREQFGTTAEDFARGGLLGAIGIDLRGSLGIDAPEVAKMALGAVTGSDRKYTPRQVAVAMLGAPASGVFDVVDSVKFLAQGDALRAAEKIAFKGVADPIRAYREATRGSSTQYYRPNWFGDEQIRPTGYDTVLRAVGFNPMGVSKKMEQQWSAKRVQAMYADWRSGIYDGFKINEELGPTREREDALWKRVDEYNARVEENKPLGVSFITADSVRAALRNVVRPPKAERDRARN